MFLNAERLSLIVDVGLALPILTRSFFNFFLDRVQFLGCVDGVFATISSNFGILGVALVARSRPCLRGSSGVLGARG